MTERQWHTTDRFRDMAAFLADPPGRPPRRLGGIVAAAARRLVGGDPPPGPAVPPSDRKFRLLTAACCRYLWRTAHLPLADLPVYRDDGWLDRVERQADGDLTPADEAAIADFLEPRSRFTTGEEYPLRFGVFDAPRRFWQLAAHKPVIPMFAWLFPESSALGSELVRDVFGNPFRPAAFDPRWRTAAALDLGRTAYAARDFGVLPILADALEEAGCDDADVLAHCRAGGPHVRGCWVVDAVLGKS